MERQFESRQVAKILGVPERSFRYWVTSKFIIPAQDSITPGIRRKYSFHNLIEGAVLRELSSQKVTMSIAAKALTKLNEVGIEDSTFLEGECVYCFLTINAGDEIEVKKYYYKDFRKDVKSRISFFTMDDEVRRYQDIKIGENSFRDKNFKDFELIKMTEYGDRYVEILITIGLDILIKGKTFLVVPVHELISEIVGKVSKEM